MNPVRFFVGLDDPAYAFRFLFACISIKRIWRRKKPIPGVEVLVDSGAFTELAMHGQYLHTVEQYAAALYRLYTTGVVRISAAVSQDYMCEAFMLARTGLTIAEHQRLTIERYDALVAELEKLFGGPCPFHIMPVLQGYAPADYVAHVVAYGPRLVAGMWVGVGSVCKRNGSPDKIVSVLAAIKDVRPDLQLHGFGVKVTALLSAGVRDMLATADSMAWSYAARKQGRDAHDWREAQAFVDKVSAIASSAPGSYMVSLFP
jgi:hypothetical protein